MAAASRWQFVGSISSDLCGNTNDYELAKFDQNRFRAMFENKEIL
jgi:hypothetical protein